MESRPVVNGIRMNVVHRGCGPVLLLVHGFPLDHTMWRHQIDGLPSLQIVAPDLRGFGRTEVPDSPASMDEYADDLASLLDVLDMRQPVTFCGLSMGGYIAWSFLRRHAHRIERLILCDTRAAADTDRAALERQELAKRVLSDGVGAAQSMSAKLFAEATRIRPARDCRRHAGRYGAHRSTRCGDRSAGDGRAARFPRLPPEHPRTDLGDMRRAGLDRQCRGNARHSPGDPGCPVRRGARSRSHGAAGTT